MGTVATTNVATATAYGNQRRIERTSNGVLWQIYTRTDGNVVDPFGLAYSTDGGVTWTAAGTLSNGSGATTTNYTANCSMKCDEDDYLTVAFKDNSNGYIYLRRGTPNAARTAYTWSAATTIKNAVNPDFPDIVVFRDPATPGAWAGYVVWTINASSSSKAIGLPISISSAGVVTPGAEILISTALATANSNPGFPSIDFNHTGDGKTVAGGTPHLYVGWSAGATGAGYGIRFRKATYAGGSWTWGTEREIDNTRWLSSNRRWLNCLFDGTRVILVGHATDTPFLIERDAADTTTTPRSLGTPAAADQTTSGSASYDALGNVYFFGVDTATGTRAQYRKWTRADGTLGAPVIFDSAAGITSDIWASARRGSQGQAIDYVYTRGSASPFTVTSGRIVLNQNPTAPTPLTPADNATWDSSVDQTVTFKHNDPDGDAASSWRIRYRPAGTSVPYAYLTGTTTAANGATVTATVPANTWDGVIEYAEQTYDPSNAEGAWSSTRVVTGVPAALAALTGGQGGTSVSVHGMVNMTQNERAMRALSLV